MIVVEIVFADTGAPDLLQSFAESVLVWIDEQLESHGICFEHDKAAIRSLENGELPLPWLLDAQASARSSYAIVMKHQDELPAELVAKVKEGKSLLSPTDVECIESFMRDDISERSLMLTVDAPLADELTVNDIRNSVEELVAKASTNVIKNIRIDLL